MKYSITAIPLKYFDSRKTNTSNFIPCDSTTKVVKYVINIYGNNIMRQ